MRRVAILLGGALLAALLGCGPSDPPDAARSTGPGTLLADLRQSSRDAALGRMEVWIVNDTGHDVTPTRIVYADPRFRAPVPGERLRLNPSGSERGYPLALPPRPDCRARSGAGRLSVEYAGRRVELAVADETDIVARYTAGRCLELAVDRVADLRFADEVPSDGSGEGSVGTLVLVARPTGLPGHVVTVDAVGGTPLLGAAGRPWRPGTRIRSDGPVQRIELPVRPARCDDHVFMESGGATAFLVQLSLDGEPGQLVIRMSPAGASAAITFARSSCGLA